MSMVHGYPVARSILDDKVGEWLYGTYDEKKLDMFQTLYHIGPIGDYFDYLLDKRATVEYMTNNQLEYSDIHDPRKLQSTGSNINGVLAARSYNMVSRNVSSLYSELGKKKKGKR